MSASRSPQSPLDHAGVQQKILAVFNQSPVFRGAHISALSGDPKGGAGLEVGFGEGPPVFRIVAPSPEKAYAILYELALAMVEPERDCVDQPGT